MADKHSISTARRAYAGFACQTGCMEFSFRSFVMQSIAFDRIAFKHYLLAKCNFSEKAGEWAWIWVDRFLRRYPG